MATGMVKNSYKSVIWPLAASILGNQVRDTHTRKKGAKAGEFISFFLVRFLLLSYLFLFFFFVFCSLFGEVVNKVRS